MTDSIGVVVVAAGSSTRMDGVDKVFAGLRGQPLIAWSLLTFESCDEVTGVVLVLSSSSIARGRALAEDLGLSRVVATVQGGARRQDSVRAGLDALAALKVKCDMVAIHDGARPFVDGDMLRRGVAAAQKTGAAVAAVPVKDTIKVAGPDRNVTETPDRSKLWAVQTPQVFRTDLIYEAHRLVTHDVTDDASMVEAIGGRTAIFDGHPENIKVTTPDDLLLADLIAARRAGEPGSVAGGSPALPRPVETSTLTRARRDGHPLSLPGRGGQAEPDRGGQAPPGHRYGTGFDGHRLTPPGPLRLGGIDVPFDMRLAGHSDGDVLLHAVTSAILGAAGLGDMGRHFPSSDPALKGIDSTTLLRRSLEVVRGRGYIPEQLDATIIAQRPRLAAYVSQMEAAIAAAAGLSPDRVNVKVTSTDGVGAIGEGQGIAAQAIAVIRPA